MLGPFESSEQTPPLPHHGLCESEKAHPPGTEQLPSKPDKWFHRLFIMHAITVGKEKWLCLNCPSTVKWYYYTRCQLFWFRNVLFKHVAWFVSPCQPPLNVYNQAEMLRSCTDYISERIRRKIHFLLMKTSCIFIYSGQSYNLFRLSWTQLVLKRLFPWYKHNITTYQLIWESCPEYVQALW